MGQKVLGLKEAKINKNNLIFYINRNSVIYTGQQVLEHSEEDKV
jgi:hypothetical protein